MRRATLLAASLAASLAVSAADARVRAPDTARIAPGVFTMGTPAEALAPLGLDPYFARREQPAREVRIDRAYRMMRREVTRGEFATFVRATGHAATPGCFLFEGARWRLDPAATWERPGFAQRDDHPVVCVNRADALAYAGWLSRATGRVWRLPSEAEWEYAARAGAATLWPWGPAWGDGCRHANAGDAATQRAYHWAGQSLGVREIQPWTPAPCDDGHAATAPAGALKANTWGLHDMIGNVQEWTADCLTPDYAAPRGQTAVTQGDCAKGVLRGQGWTGGPNVLRPAFRLQVDAAERRFTWGLRLVADD
jgi:formylglycine-generating enzyme required for sulfatase activity